MMIAMVRALSKTEVHSLKNREEEDYHESFSFWKFKWVDKYILLPDKYSMIAWSTFATFCNLLTLLFILYEEGYRMRV